MSKHFTEETDAVNAWADKYNIWLAEQIDRYGCAGYEVKLPRLEASNINVCDAPLYRQDIGKRIMDANIRRDYAFKTQNAATAVAAYQLAMSKLHCDEDAIIGATQEAKAAAAVARTAQEVGRYFATIVREVSQYESYNDAQVFAAEADLRFVLSTAVAYSVKVWREYQGTLFTDFETSQTGKEALRLHYAASVVWIHRDEIAEVLFKLAWP